MKMNKLAIASCVVSLLLCGAVGSADAVGLKTHMGFSSSDHVTLVSNSVVNACTILGLHSQLNTRVQANSNIVQYEIPEGYSLVLTDISWNTTGGRANVLTKAQIYMADKVLQFPKLMTTSASLSDVSGEAAGSLTINSGFVVNSNSILCVLVMDSTNNVPTSHVMTAQGYLVKTK